LDFAETIQRNDAGFSHHGFVLGIGILVQQWHGRRAVGIAILLTVGMKQTGLIKL